MYASWEPLDERTGQIADISSFQRLELALESFSTFLVSIECPGQVILCWTGMVSLQTGYNDAERSEKFKAGAAFDQTSACSSLLADSCEDSVPDFACNGRAQHADGQLQRPIDA